MASATTRLMARSEARPALMSEPSSLSCVASSRPWSAIHKWCQPSIRTAASMTAALKISWPWPDRALESAPANRASTLAPRAPATTPAPIQRVRPAMPSVAANTMPTISPASSTSRKTMSRLASMSAPSHAEHALGQRRIIVAEESVDAGLQRPDHHDDGRMRGHDLFDLEVVALEFLGRGVQVVHLDRKPLAGRGGDRAWREVMVL